MALLSTFLEWDPCKLQLHQTCVLPTPYPSIFHSPKNPLNVKNGIRVYTYGKTAKSLVENLKENKHTSCHCHVSCEQWPLKALLIPSQSGWSWGDVCYIFHSLSLQIAGSLHSLEKQAASPSAGWRYLGKKKIKKKTKLNMHYIWQPSGFCTQIPAFIREISSFQFFNACLTMWPLAS